MIASKFHKQPTGYGYYEDHSLQPAELPAFSIPPEFPGPHSICELPGYPYHPAHERALPDQQSQSLDNNNLAQNRQRCLAASRPQPRLSMEATSHVRSYPSSQNVSPSRSSDMSPTTTNTSSTLPSCSPSTISPTSPTRWENFGHSHPSLISEQNEGKERSAAPISIERSIPLYYGNQAKEYPQGDIEPIHDHNTPHALPAGSISPFISQRRIAQQHNSSRSELGQHSGTSWRTGSGSQGSPVSVDGNAGMYESSVPETHSHADSTAWGKASDVASQHQRMYASQGYNTLFQHKDNCSHNYDEAPPMYQYASNSPEVTPSAFQVGQFYDESQFVTPPSERKRKRGKRAIIAEAVLGSFHLLSCTICNTTFSGPYRKGNLQRHFRGFHSLPSAMDDSDKKCRECGIVYNRADARRKHEWKKHKIAESRPEKRRKEKRNPIPMVRNLEAAFSERTEGLAELY